LEAIKGVFDKRLGNGAFKYPVSYLQSLLMNKGSRIKSELSFFTIFAASAALDFFPKLSVVFHSWFLEFLNA